MSCRRVSGGRGFDRSSLRSNEEERHCSLLWQADDPEGWNGTETSPEKTQRKSCQYC